MNVVNPNIKYDESDIDMLEEVYEEIKFIMGTQGYSLDSASEIENSEKIYHTTRNGIEAIGVYAGEYFEILEGSQIDMSRATKIEKYNELRKKLLDDGQIILENDKYILKINYRFKTPSGAAEFVLGGTANGWIEWKDSNNKTLDDIIRK